MPRISNSAADNSCASRASSVGQSERATIIARLAGMRMTAATTKLAAMVADLSKSLNQRPTSAPLRAKKIGIGIAYIQ